MKNFLKALLVSLALFAAGSYSPYTQAAFGSVSSTFGDSTNIAVSTPSGTVAGDILVFGVSLDSAVSVVTWPTGFTNITGSPITQLSPDGHSFWLATKVATGSEGATLTATVLSAGGGWTAFIARYTGRNTTSPRNAQSAANNTSANTSPVTVIASSITTTIVGCDILYVAGLDGSDAVFGAAGTAPSGFAERVDLSSTNRWSNIYLADMSQVGSGATGNLSGSFTFTAPTAGWMAFALALSPIPPARRPLWMQ